MPKTFDLEDFLPYLLNQAAEVTSQAFQVNYRDAYGMTRTQWRVLANLGKFGAMTARDICVASHIEKTKVSRAVATLEVQGYLTRTPAPDDGRAENLALTAKGQDLFGLLGQKALAFDADLRRRLGPDAEALTKVLRALIARGLPRPSDQGEDV